MKHYETYFYSTFFAFLFLFSLVHAGCYYFYLDLHPGKSGTQAPGDLANKYNVKRKRNLWKIGWSQNVADVGVSWSLLSFSGQTSKWSTNATHCYTQQNLGKESENQVIQTNKWDENPTTLDSIQVLNASLMFYTWEIPRVCSYIKSQKQIYNFYLFYQLCKTLLSSMWQCLERVCCRLIHLITN